jgi:hypothetical protein
MVFSIYFVLLFCISFLGALIRIYVFSHAGLYLPSLFDLILSVGAGQALPLPDPDQPPQPNYYWGDELRPVVAAALYPQQAPEPEAQQEGQQPQQVVRNVSFESSLRGRIVRLEEKETPFLMDKKADGLKLRLALMKLSVRASITYY